MDIKKENRSVFWYWCSIDFANSLLYTNLILYLPTWLTIDHGMSDFLFNTIFIGSTILSLIFAPLLGINADANNNRIFYLRLLNVLVIVFGIIIAIVGISYPNINGAYFVGFIFMLLNASYLLSLQFYDSILPDIQSNTEIAKGSAIGFSMGWIGAIVGVLSIMPIVSDTSESRLYGILAATVLGSIILIPALFKLKENQFINNNLNKYKESWNFKSFLRLIYKKPVMWFLVGYFIFMDSILTIQDNLSIYLERVFGMSDDVKGLVAVGIIIAGVVGALSTMRIKNTNSIKDWIFRLVIFSSIFVISSSLASNTNISLILLVLAFLIFGGIISLSRAYFSSLSDPQHRSSSFSWYSISQKSSSLIGPLIWGGIVAGTSQYSIALLFMGLLMLVSIFPILKIKE